MSSNRVSILIDGGNFYHLALKEIGATELSFDFDKFSEFLANGRQVNGMCKRYYIGTVSEVEGDLGSKLAMSNQTTLFNRLKMSGWEIKKSKLRKRIEKVSIDYKVENCEELLSKEITEIRYIRLREKGIDVKIATDLIAGAVDDQYDTAIIVSSDTDLVPAIDWIRNRTGKKIEYVGFSMPHDNPDESIKPSLTLVSKTDIQRTLVTSDLESFLITEQEDHG